MFQNYVRIVKPIKIIANVTLQSIFELFPCVLKFCLEEAWFVIQNDPTLTLCHMCLKKIKSGFYLSKACSKRKTGPYTFGKHF